jgi:hypothetical protein
MHVIIATDNNNKEKVTTATIDATINATRTRSTAIVTIARRKVIWRDNTIFKFTGWQHANPDGESATNQATKIGRQKVCQQHNSQPENAGVSPQVQKGTVGLNQHFSLRRVSLS